MGNKTCKIERAGLSDVVQKLVADGVTTRAAVADVLRDDYGLEISDASVGRYLARIKNTATSKAFQIISDHVDRTVPDDLNALEAMEALAYGWAMEASVPQAQRLADAASKIAEKLDYWKALILSEITPPKDKIKEIISECLSMVQEDARSQEQRLKAMRAAVNIIDLKLSKAGLLDDDAKGKIVLLTRQAVADEIDTPQDRSKVIRFSKPGSSKDDAGELLQ